MIGTKSAELKFRFESMLTDLCLAAPHRKRLIAAHDAVIAEAWRTYEATSAQEVRERKIDAAKEFLRRNGVEV